MNYWILASCGVSAAPSAAAEHVAGEIAAKTFSRTDLSNTPGSGWSSSLSAGEKNLKTPNFPADIWQDQSPARNLYPWESWGALSVPECWLSTGSVRTLNQQSGWQASGRSCSTEARVAAVSWGAGGECEHPRSISVCAQRAPVWLSYHSARFSKSATHHILPLHKWWDLHTSAGKSTFPKGNKNEYKK